MCDVMMITVCRLSVFDEDKNISIPQTIKQIIPKSRRYDRMWKMIWISSFYRPQTKFAKVMSSQVSVYPQGWGGSLPHCMLGYTRPPWDQADTPREQTPPGADTPSRSRHPRGTRHPPGADTPPQCMLGDTGNKRAVRILLECMLVFLTNLNVM